jgi:hypothetical protein
MCNKMSFESAKQARRHLNTIRTARNSGSCDHKKLRAYLCPDCGKYHLTSSKKLSGNRKSAHDKRLRNALI